MWFWYWIVKYSGVLLFTLNSYFDLVALIPINGLNHCCWIVKYCKWCSGFYIEFLFRFVPLLLEDNLASCCLDLDKWVELLLLCGFVLDCIVLDRRIL